MAARWHLGVGMVIGIIAAYLTATAVQAAEAADRPLIDFNVKGGWCWFQDERALVDGDKLIFGSVAHPSGDVNVTTYDFSTGTAVTVPLHEKFQSDDHNAPAFLKLPDGRYLASYASHGGAGGLKGTDLMRWRISTRPGDATEWGPPQTLSVGAGISYSNLYRLSAQNGRIYNFHRGIGFNPNYMLSDDDGKTFRYGGRLFNWPAQPAQPGSGRPYVRYASDHVNVIHLITTEDHPRNFDNSIYHGYIKNGQIHRSDGSIVGPLSTTPQTSIRPTDLTCVFRGDADNVAWTVDIRLDATGKPYIAFSVQKGNGNVKADYSKGGEDLRYYYGRWDGSQWRVYHLAYAGSRLYSPEVDYSGLVTLHPGDPNIVYISTNADPISGNPLISQADGQRHYEIFKGTTSDAGKSWTWLPFTANSKADNIRPIARVLDKRRAVVIWQQGTYRTYTHYDMNVVGVVDTTAERH